MRGKLAYYLGHIEFEVIKLNIIVCYKIVPCEQDITIRQDGTLSFDKAEWEIGQYDLMPVEAAMQLVEEVGGRVSALSIGSKQLDNSKLKKGILSRGPEELFVVIDETLENIDTFQTASTLASAIGKIGDYDLILFGEGSSDLYAQQVGPQVGELLKLPTLNSISKITPLKDQLVVERTLENEVEVLEVNLPAVICVTTDINLPRIPTMKDILASGKKPVTQWKFNDLECRAITKATEITNTLAPPQAERKQIIFEGDSEEVVSQFFDSFRKAL